MKKRLIALAILAVVLPALVMGYSFLAKSTPVTPVTYEVKGKITDLASNEPVAGVKIKIAGYETESGKDGNYFISGIKASDGKELTFQAPQDYLKADSVRVNFSKKTTEQNIALKPTLEKTSKILYDAISSEKYDIAWNIIHPDDKKYWGGKTEYVNFLKESKKMQKYFNIQEMTYLSDFESYTSLDRWKHNITKKDYDRVLKVPVKADMKIEGGDDIMNYDDYYQDIDGFYHVFTNTDKDEFNRIRGEMEKSMPLGLE